MIGLHVCVLCTCASVLEKKGGGGGGGGERIATMFICILQHVLHAQASCVYQNIRPYIDKYSYRPRPLTAGPLACIIYHARND